MWTTNPVTTSFASKVPTVTEPAGTGIIALGMDGATAPNGLIVVPYGTTTDNTTFALRILGWRSVIETISGVRLTEWIPIVLAELGCTLCTMAAAAGGVLVAGGATPLMVDTITLVTGNDDISIDIVSPTGDVPAHVVIDVKGFEKAEFQIDLTGAVSGNALIAPL